jgi:hypothetical protein
VSRRAWATEHGRALSVLALAGLWLGAATAIAVLFSGRIRDWSVMTDELLYAKLATSIAETGSPLPSVHGTSIEVYSQLYPLLLAPLFGALTPPDAFRAAHVLNAFVMVSAAFPAYLLARQIVTRAWSLAVAALSIAVPWMILTGFLMTEVAAYPAFLWALLAFQLSIADPSRRHDLLAVGGLVLAVLVRTQFVALALVLPIAIGMHEIAEARSARKGARAAVAKHRVLAVLLGLAVVGAALVALVDSAGGVLGVYAVTVEKGSLLPAGIWAAAARHVDAVAIGSGLVPFLLGGGWMLASVVRPHTSRVRALATLALVTFIVLAFEVASFGVRFGSEVVRDRYLFYVVPLLLVGTAAALSRTPTRHLALGSAIATIFFAATAASLPFTIYPGVWVDSPASVLNELLIEQSGDLGTGTFVALLGLMTGVVLVLGVLFAPRRLFAAVAVGTVAVFSVLTLENEADRVLSSTGLSGRPLAEPPGVVLDWVDGAASEGEVAAVVAFPVSTAWDTTAIRWWDLELWNSRAARAYTAEDGNFTYTPFPAETLEIDSRTGGVAGTSDAPELHVTAPRDPRFQLAGSVVAENVGLVIRRVERPYRALWLTEGLEPDGWTRPGQRALLRVFGAGSVAVSITLRAPDAGPARYEISAGRTQRAGDLATAAEQTERLVVCVPDNGYADITVAGESEAEIPALQISPTATGTRRAGVLVGAIEVGPARRRC